MKLALGTVQFGLDYGISNQQGQVSTERVRDILQEAKALGIDTLDCAAAYGNSEKILGNLSVNQVFNLICKIPGVTIDQSSILPFFQQSLANLQCDKVDALLFHQADDLLNHRNKAQFFSQLLSLKKTQQVNRIGVSVYSPEQLIATIQSYDIDIAQVPINIFDQRFISKSIMEQCQQKQVKLHARSVFLQGLLFIEQEKIPPYFKPYQEKLRSFSALAQHLSCSKLTLALTLLAKKSDTNDSDAYNNVIEKLVVGVCNTSQLKEIVSAYKQAEYLNISSEEIASLADARLNFINPSLWQV